MSLLTRTWGLAVAGVLIAAMLTIGGCARPLVSVHALATDENATFDPGLVGMWEYRESDEDEGEYTEDQEQFTLEISAEGERAYLCVLTGKGFGDDSDIKDFRHELDMRIVEIGDAVFADFALTDDEAERILGVEGIMWAVPIHHIVRIERKGDVLRIAMGEEDEDQPTDRALRGVPHAASEPYVLLTGAGDDLVEHMRLLRAQGKYEFDEDDGFFRRVKPEAGTR